MRDVRHLGHCFALAMASSHSPQRCDKPLKLFTIERSTLVHIVRVPYAIYHDPRALAKTSIRQNKNARLGLKTMRNDCMRKRIDPPKYDRSTSNPNFVVKASKASCRFSGSKFRFRMLGRRRRPLGGIGNIP